MSKGVHVKKLIVAAIALSALTASTFIVSPSASAVNTKSKSAKSAKVPAIKCLTAKSVGHTPPSIAPADKVLRRIPRTFTFVTNCGNIVVTTVGSKAPITLTQLSTLARGGGGGGPNFTYRDENLPVEGLNNYPAGTVAMANSGPGTNGSQFFLVFADTTLGANYTIWGTVTQGLDIVKAIAKVGVKGGGADGAPNQPIEIRRVSVSN